MGQESIEFRNYYQVIFSANYLFQGINNSLFTVIIPIYLIQIIGSIDASSIAFIASIIMIPWVFKIFYGMIGDKFGSKRFGRRRPWIVSMVSFSGIMWIFLSLPFIYTIDNIIFIFTIMGLLIFLGVSFGDTILDGLVLDITPKEKLGRTSGFNWSMRSVGTIAGGPAFSLFVVIGIIDVSTLFLVMGVLSILSSLLIFMVKEPKSYPKVTLGRNLKDMFNNKRDWKTYVFALFNAIVDSVAMLVISIYILVQMGVLSSVGTSLSLPGGNINIYLYNGNISIIISLGIVIGSVFGGQIADKVSRKLSVYIGYVITTISLILMMISALWQILLIFSLFVGGAIGWRHSSYSAVATQISKLHPEMDSTFYSMCNAFANFGSIFGLILIGLILELTGSYLMIFLSVAIISNLGLIGFVMLEPKFYESEAKSK